MATGIKNIIIEETFNEIKEEINNLKKEIKPLITRDTEVLKKRYYEELSYFQQLALWYDSFNWWQEIILNVVIFAAVVLTSMVLHAVTLITFFSMVVFNLVALAAIEGLIVFLKNENDIDKKRAERMCADVIQVENNLKTSITLFETTHEKLLDLFNETNEANQALNNYTLSLEEKTQNMTAEIENFKTIISNLKKIQEELGINTQGLVKSEEGLLKNLTTLETLISQDVNFSQLNQEINETTKECHESTALLTSVNGLMRNFSKSLNESIEAIKGDIDSLSTEVANEQKEMASPAVLNLPTVEEINHQQEEAERLLAEAQIWLREAKSGNGQQISNISTQPAFNC
ncbi:MAG: hypothetical protein K2X39_07595 [Silvanigrellaceae bacterium]|nr:hypothetical protein [Silvanigrellaceae bacterium]